MKYFFLFGPVLENIVSSVYLVQRGLSLIFMYCMYTNKCNNESNIQYFNFFLLVISSNSYTRIDVCVVIDIFSFNFVSSDPGKTLPEALDYCTVWLQTVPGEIDSKSGIPPSLVTLQIKDFLNGPGKKVIIQTLFFLWVS